MKSIAVRGQVIVTCGLQNELLWDCRLELGREKLMYLKFCQIASEELTYSGVLVLLAADKQAECVVDSELGCVKLVFLKAMSNGLGKIDFGVVFADWL